MSDTSSHGTMAFIMCMSDNVAYGTRVGRFRFVTYGGSGTFTGLQISNTGVGGEASIGFLGASAIGKQTITGYRSGSAMDSLLSALEDYGLITDATGELSYLYLLWSAETSGDASQRLYVGGTQSGNSQLAGRFESGSNYALVARTGNGGIPLLAETYSTANNTDQRALLLQNSYRGASTVTTNFGTYFQMRGSIGASGGSTVNLSMVRAQLADAGATTYRSRVRHYVYGHNAGVVNALTLEAGTTAGLSRIGFFGTTAADKQTVTGHTGNGSAVASLASALSTYGLITSSIATSGQTLNIVTVGASGVPATITVSATGDVYVCYWTATVNLPALATVPGKVFVIKSKSAQTVTITPNGAETIDGSGTLTITTLNGYARIVNDGVEWSVIG